MSLAAAAILAYGLADLVNRLLSASGGFILHPLGYQLAPVHTWANHAWVTGEGLLALFGAKPQGPAVELAFALLHLAGVALVAWAICRVVRRFVSWPDLVSQVLLLAIVLNVLVYIPSTLADATDLNAREFAVVLPFGAVLAGRVLAEPLTTRLRGGEVDVLGWLRGRRWRAGLASALAVGYLASLGYAAAQPSVPPANAQLATFLAEHHLTNGISGYWHVEHRHRRQRRGGHDPGRAVLAAALPMGNQGLLVRPRLAARDLPGHREQDWLLQPLAAQRLGSGGPGPARPHLPCRAVYRAGLEQEPAQFSRPLTPSTRNCLPSTRHSAGTRR